MGDLGKIPLSEDWKPLGSMLEASEFQPLCVTLRDSHMTQELVPSTKTGEHTERQVDSVQNPW